MKARWHKICRIVAFCIAFGSVARQVCAEDSHRYNVVVMDSLSLPLSCACVPGVGQRRYEPLIEFVSARTKSHFKLAYEESLQLAQRRGMQSIDIVIGKRSVVLADARATNRDFRAVCELTDRTGSTTIQGVLLVAKSSNLKTLADLAGHSIALASAEHFECHGAVKELLKEHQVDVSVKAFGSIEEAVYAFDDGNVSVVAVSDYLPPMLEGCGKLAKGSTRVIGRTRPSEDVQIFVAATIPQHERERLAEAFAASAKEPTIRLALESKQGIRRIETAEDWTDWRGPRRDGRYESLPKTMDQPDILWRAKLTGPAMAGLSATVSHVFVADKTSDFKQDVFRAFDSRSGNASWTVTVDAPDKMDYTNAPRATPVIVGDRVLLQSAFGKLLCVEASSGKAIWSKHLAHDFRGELPTWGYCVPPLVVDGNVIVAPGGAEKSLVALSLENGAERWSSPGNAAAYAPFIVGTFGGKRQLVGYDSAGLGGWDLESGERLWEMVPPDASDFNVATPVVWRDGIVLATENNGTRYYEFTSEGQIVVEPKWTNIDCAPDTCTPVVARTDGNEKLFCTAYGELFCLNGSDLSTEWSEADDRFYDHTCLIAGNDRLMMWSNDADLLLFDTSAEELTLVSATRPMSNRKAESMSHPAIVGDKLFLRSQTELICIQLPETAASPSNRE